MSWCQDDRIQIMYTHSKCGVMCFYSPCTKFLPPPLSWQHWGRAKKKTLFWDSLGTCCCLSVAQFLDAWVSIHRHMPIQSPLLSSVGSFVTLFFLTWFHGFGMSLQLSTKYFDTLVSVVYFCFKLFPLVIIRPNFQSCRSTKAGREAQKYLCEGLTACAQDPSFLHAVPVTKDNMTKDYMVSINKYFWTK